MKSTKEFKSLSREQLEERLGEFKKELLKANVQIAAGNTTASAGKVKQTKKNVARVLTIFKEKEVIPK